MNTFEVFGFFMLGSLFNAVLILLLISGIFRSIGKQLKEVIEAVSKLIEKVKVKSDGE